MSFVCGLFVGVMLGILLMCLLSANREDDDYDL